jgi:hypothetical protein
VEEKEKEKEISERTKRCSQETIEKLLRLKINAYNKLRLINIFARFQ